MFSHGPRALLPPGRLPAWLLHPRVPPTATPTPLAAFRLQPDQAQQQQQRGLCLSAARPGWGNEHQPTPRGKRRPNRHKDPWWRKARAAKVVKIQLPDKEFDRRMSKNLVSPAEIREKMKQMGFLPPAPYEEKPQAYIASTGAIIEQFVPPEGDGKASFLSKEGATTTAMGVQKKGKSYMATRKIRQYEEDFDPRKFAEQAHEIYVKAHQALANRDEDTLLKYATEKAHPEMTHNAETKTLRWQMLKTLEPPRVVQVRTMPVLSDTNLYAQVTVRMNTQQTLAVYDRFGRLIHGSPVTAKDVLEYVVFEKHIVNYYGEWRLHGKIIPDWMAPKPAGMLTQVLQEEAEEEAEEEEGDDVTEVAKGDAEEVGEKEEEKVYDKYGRPMRKEQ